MNFKHLPILLILTLVSLVSSCNSDDYEIITIEDPSQSSVEVLSLRLSRNYNLLANLDSVFFTVDLETARIFNADSLPVGTPVRKFVLDIETANVSKREFIYKTSSGRDSIITYSENGLDSIDFTYGPVYLRLTSLNEKVIRQYQIDINVHKTKPDSLFWNRSDIYGLPGTVSAPTVQKTSMSGGKIFTLTSSGTDLSLSWCENPAANSWTIVESDFPDSVDVESFCGADSVLYVLSEGVLYMSSDEGETWESTGVEMDYLYGGYESSVLGVKNSNGIYQHVTYPETTETEVPSGCPISGTSSPLIFTSEWSSKPMFMVMGGTTADGTLCGDVWAYDGKRWSSITVAGVPAWTGASFFPYYTMDINNQWEVTISDVLVSMGGMLADGSISNTVYISKDRGIHWVTAPQYMQSSRTVSELIRHRNKAQVIVSESTLSTPQSRVAAPITEWECPYIYVFGGYDSTGRFGGVRRGVINYFTFIPIY